MSEKLEQITINDWTLKVHIPEGNGPFPVVMLMHGWTGDENSMWVFGSQLSKEYMMIAPRGLHPSEHPEYGGYSWVNQRSGEWPWLADFRSSIDAVEDLLGKLPRRFDGDFGNINMVGFSQGAALAIVYSLIYPQRMNQLSILSGFVPEKCEEIASTAPLQDLAVFLGHGSLDKTVPIAKAYQAKKLLEIAGAKVSLCESEVGHKLGANCFKAFRDFMSLPK